MQRQGAFCFLSLLKSKMLTKCVYAVILIVTYKMIF